MLSFFRRGIMSKLMLGVLAIGLFAIVITGFGTGGSGLGGVGAGSSTLASVGDETVTSTELTDQVNRQLTRAREQQPELDLPRFLRTGVFEEALRGLISVKALLSFGRDVGLAASKLMVDREIASIPAFQNLAGQFDNAAFQAALARQNVTEQALRSEIEASIIQRQLLLPIAGNARVPQSLALQYASLLLERRQGSVGIVPAEAMPAGPAPTDAELQTFYNQNRTRYTLPERRVLRYAVFGPDKVAAQARPTDAEIANYYRTNAARYAAQETRDLSQVVLPTQQAAQQFAAKLARGTSFQQAAAEAGFSAGDIRQAGQNRQGFSGISSPAIANAAFGAAEGAVTQPIQSELGWHIVRIDKINRTPARALEAVRGEIAAALTQQKTEAGLADLVTRIEDSLADGSSFEEVARANGLQVQETPPVTAAGAGATTDIQPLLKTAFEMAEDEDPVVETIQQGQRFAMLAVGRIVPAAPPPLAQIADRVRTDLVAQRQAQRARQVAAAIVAKINAGTAPAQAFAQAGIALPAPQPINARRMDISQGGAEVPPPLQMMFSMKRGTAKLLEAPNRGGWFVVHLATTEAGDARGNQQLIQATQAQFGQVASDELAQQFTNAVERQLEVERNEDAIRALKRQLQGPGAQ
ncbi:MAG TPA: peptidyl-prolyl cis-trans isomerase [Allosphingosinicella sp.]|uniref:peptidylprolyl isomerase n=1 Tax=Allosphingosinicella sp. TaxID=2823234 RepID=UPI002ED93E09